VSVISWLAVITLLQLSLWPFLKKTFREFAFPAAFSGSILLFTLLTWYCGLLRLPVQLGIVPFLAFFAYHFYRKEYTLDELKAQWHWEILFLLCFLLMLDVRFVNPTISYAEKFMDHAFLASVIRDPVIPPLDPWFAQGTLNIYYYLGYWMLGCLSIVSGVPSNIAFNLSLPTVFALAAVNLYAVGSLLLNRFRWLPLLTFLLPNPSFFWQLLQGKGLGSIVWDSTRTITNTINEYPLFSFIWGDVHAHVISIFNQCFLLFILVFVYRNWESLETRGKIIAGALGAISLGSMPLINTWDVLIYAPVTVIVIILILHRTWRTDDRTSSFALLTGLPAAAILSYLPFYFQLQTHTGGVGIVRTPSDPAEFLLVSGFFIAILIAFLAEDIRKRPWLMLIAIPFIAFGYIAATFAAIPAVYFTSRLLTEKRTDSADLLAVFGLVILIACELFYLKDNMGDTYFRMNTVFKAYLPAWILLSTASFVMVARWLSFHVPAIQTKTSVVLILTVTGVLFILPFVIGFNADYGTYTLDGLAYVGTDHPGDAAAVGYLRNLSGSETLVEAEKGDYTYYSRISSFTGIPGIIGMPFHEYMWRGDDTGWFAMRLADVKAIYEQPGRSAELMKKYSASLIIVGDAERQRYNVTIQSNGNFTRIFSADGTDIYRLVG